MKLKIHSFTYVIIPSMKILLAFLIGVLIGVGSFCGYIIIYQPLKPQILSQKIENTNDPNLLESPIPSNTPSLEPKTPSPSPKERIPTPISQSPSVKSSPVATNSPKPTITPTPSPTATPDVWSPPQMEPLFAQYAGQYNVDKNALERIANCESHFNPTAKNGDYLGMFQFATSSWQTNRNLLGLDNNPNIRTNIEESIRTAAFLMSRQGTKPWPSCV